MNNRNNRNDYDNKMNNRNNIRNNDNRNNIRNNDDRNNDKRTDNHDRNRLDNYKRYFHSAKTCLMKNDTEYVIKIEIPAETVKWTIDDNQVVYFSYIKNNEYDNYEIVYNEMRFGERNRRVKLPSKVNPIPKKESCVNGIYTLVFTKLEPIFSCEKDNVSLLNLSSNKPISDEQTQFEGTERIIDWSDIL